MRDECCAARGSQQHMPEQLWHSNAATVPGSSRLKAAPKRKLLTARQSLHPTRKRAPLRPVRELCGAIERCADSSARSAFCTKSQPFFVARTPIEKISCAGRRFHLSPRAADEIFQPLAKRPIPSKMRQWQKGQGSAQVAPASMPAPPWTVESAFPARACETPQLQVSSARAPAGRALR